LTDGSIACIGAGSWGRNLIRNFDHLGALGAIVEYNPAAAAAIAEQYPGTPVLRTLAELKRLPGIRAVAIAAPAESHGDLVGRSFDEGYDVFVEKPLCMDVEEGERLVGRAEREGRVLMVGHLLWYHSAILRLQELIRDGELGRIQYIYSNRLNLGKIRREENILWSFAPHDISVILGLVGEQPNFVHAHGANYLHQQIADVTVSVFGFPSGIRAHIFVSWLHPFKEQKLIVVGDRKMAVFDDVARDYKLVLYPHSIEWRNNQPVPNRGEMEPIELPATEPLGVECSHFLECLQTRERPRTDGREALAVLRVLRECQRALDGGAPAAMLGLGDATPARPPGPLVTDAAAEAAGARKPPFFVHESSYIDEDVEIGEGTMIWHFSHVLGHCRIGRSCRIGQNVVIGPRVSIGDNVKIQNNVSVYEGVTLEDHVFCGPSMVFTNVHNPRSEIRRMDELRPTLVRRGVSLGANCTVVCGTTIGEYAFVGAGAVVTRDVPAHALVVGNPARVTGWMCVCGHRLQFESAETTCSHCGRHFEQSSNGVLQRTIEAAPISTS
jgi:UDP-2-acetamido-3-amino-2,3-dideoxy-glucuronate N-acetyltransferase